MMWKKNVVQAALNFSYVFYIEVEQVLFVRQECFSLLNFVHSVSALEKNTSSNLCSKQSGCAGLTGCLILLLSALVGLMLHAVENVLV